MPDSQLLEDLKRQALERATRRGHRLGVFQTAARDPDHYVSLCRDCRHLLLIHLAGPGAGGARLFGYALEVSCDRGGDAAVLEMASGAGRDDAQR
jgi:hypothetical protein